MLEAFRSAVQALGPARLVVTFRAPEEGGAAAGVTDERRGEFLAAAVTAGSAFVDAELRGLQRRGALFTALSKAPGLHAATKLVVSFHDFGGTPAADELRKLRREAEEAGADIVKLAVTTKTSAETLPLAELLREEHPWTKPLLALGMGEAGFWTRVLGPLFPHAAPFTYARGEGAPGTAPGQPTWRELEELYRFRQIRPEWPVYGVIGNPIAHSLSPLLHNTALATLGLEGVYLPFKVEGDPLAFVRDLAPKLGLRGISVTLPHKEAVLPGCSTVDALARQIGAANTLVRRETGAWHASNTDAQAAAESLELALGGAGALRGRTVLILGAGGAARAVAFGVKARGATVWLYNRTRERAEKLAHAVAGRCVLREELSRKEFRVDAVVNTTPLGMHPNIGLAPLEESELPRCGILFDTIYNPLRTRLVRMAEGRGFQTLDGLTMFVGQGVAQFEHFTGRAAPRASMETAVRNALERRTQAGAS